MKNVEINVEGNILTVKVDLTKAASSFRWISLSVG